MIDVDTIGENVPLLEGIRTTRALRRLRPDPVPRRGAPQLQALFPAVQNVLLACRAAGLGASLDLTRTDARRGAGGSRRTCAQPLSRLETLNTASLTPSS